jgi:cholesterol transport system auxiliary component
MTMRRFVCGVTAVSAMACMILAAGCGAARPAKYYQLTVPADMTAANRANAIPVTILLGALTGSHLYREDRIVYSSAGQNMGTYEYQRWAEPPTEMIQDVLFRQMRASARYRSVGLLRSSARGDFILRGRLYDFKEVEANPAVARVALEYELRDVKTGETVWSQFYSHDEPVGGKDVSSVVAALDRNVQGLIGQVRGGLDQYFSAHPPASNATTPAQ